MGETDYSPCASHLPHQIETLSNVLSRIEIGGAQRDVMDFSADQYLDASETGHGGRREGGVDRGRLAV